MKKYTVYYLNTYKQGSIEEYWQKIEAESTEQAYEKFIEKVGIFPRVVHVDSGLMKSEAFDSHLAEYKKIDPDFDPHLAEFKKLETEKEAVDAKESFNEQISELIKEQGLDKPESSTEKLLIKIIGFQQKQLELNLSQSEELKKLNFKLMMFWIFLVVLPVLGWLLTQ